jgi:hypothetical protein
MAIESLMYAGETSLSAMQAGSSPTVRLFASREGLIGRNTANGHKVSDADRFVALPSKRVLNPLGKSDYRVRITSADRSVEAPVWDVGPWNQKDNYWDENREMFSDLPRFVPQAFAAWADNYNGGKDGTGRWVSFPSSIDISDAAFVDDLKLKSSSWVDVTFLWLDAASPPKGPTPAVLGLKPQSTKSGQARAVVASPAPPQRTSAQTTTPPSAPPPIGVAPTSAPASAAVAPPAVAAAAPGAPEKELPYAQYFSYVPIDAGADSWIVLQNVADQSSSAQIQFARVDGQRESRMVTVPGSARYSVSAAQLIGAGEYSVEINSDRQLAAERSIFLGADATNISGIVAPSRTWFFPEGSTESPMETLVALANPGTRDALTTMTFLGDRGTLRSADIRLARGARALVNLADMVPPGGVSTVVDSDEPLVAERITFINNRTAGDGTTGSVAASTTWAFSDANTTLGVDTWMILLNPADVEGTVLAKFFTDSGPMGERTYTIPARSRMPIHLNDEAPDARFGIVLSTDQPIVAERSEYLNDGTNPVSSLSVLGATDPGTSWLFPEGASQDAKSETIAVLNAGDSQSTVRFEFFGDKGRVHVARC